MKDSKKFFKCSCHGEGILISKFDGEKEFYFSFWREGMSPIKLSWWMRLKLCFLALVSGNYFEDQVVFTEKEAQKMATWITSEVNKNKLERQRKINEDT